ncbi:hypothetical protein SKAU_G00165130 [Synaphobranchus kaupii]|uniref:Uncharacterized protein n=1 Tax=Synaphobranchus kaupii TaxID=118154 RepID=A0A9Q1IZT8_SYNKA|nr:hypothetical protein SKAU_G00165130 [Synaphobranchus kaupii]
MQYGGNEEPSPRHGYGLAGRGPSERRMLDERGWPECSIRPGTSKKTRGPSLTNNVKEAITDDLEQTVPPLGGGVHTTTVRKDQQAWAWSPGSEVRGEDRLYSRFEPICALEKKQPPSDNLRKLATNAQVSERSRDVINHTRRNPPEDHYSSSGSPTRTNDNKVGPVHTAVWGIYFIKISKEPNYPGQM